MMEWYEFIGWALLGIYCAFVLIGLVVFLYGIFTAKKGNYND